MQIRIDQERYNFWDNMNNNETNTKSSKLIVKNRRQLELFQMYVTHSLDSLRTSDFIFITICQY